jgi:hypothetical protein
MNTLTEIRNQEMMCRERALLDSERREFWLAKAEEWNSALLMRLRSALENAMMQASRVPPLKQRPAKPRKFKLPLW